MPSVESVLVNLLREHLVKVVWSFGSCFWWSPCLIEEAGEVDLGDFMGLRVVCLAGFHWVLEASSFSLWLGQVFCIVLSQLVDFDSVVGGRELSMMVLEESNLLRDTNLKGWESSFSRVGWHN